MVAKGHASAIKAQYATGSEGSFDPAVNPITKMTAYEAYIDEVNRRTTNYAIALRAKYNKFKPILEQKTDQLVSKEIIDARLAQEALYEMKLLIDPRFGHGTWSYILEERKKDEQFSIFK